VVTVFRVIRIFNRCEGVVMLDLVLYGVFAWVALIVLILGVIYKIIGCPSGREMPPEQSLVGISKRIECEDPLQDLGNSTGPAPVV
jgi:hypothetical protein